MRLTEQQSNTIRAAAQRRFGSDVSVYLFGSRVDDAKRGGDIDLYVETPETDADVLNRKLAMNADLQIEMGEQKIDIVVHRQGQPLRPIDRSARRSRIQL